MPNFIKIAMVNDVPSGTGKVVEADGKQIALFNLDGKFYALDNTCLHRGGPVGEGDIQGSTVTCPWHGWQYNIATGESLTAPGKKLSFYEIKVEGDEIKIGLE